MNALMLAFTVMLSLATPKKPTLKWLGADPALTGHYLASNPTRDHLEMSVLCGEDYEIFVLDLLPGTQQEVVVTKPGGNGFANSCFVEGWKKVK